VRRSSFARSSETSVRDCPRCASPLRVGASTRALTNAPRSHLSRAHLSAPHSYLVAVARVCSRRFPTVVGRRHAAQTSRFLLIYLLCYTAPAVRHAWILRQDFTGSNAYSVLQFVEAVLLPLAGFLNAVVYGLNRHFTPQSGLRALLRGESGVMVGESKVVSFKDHRYLNADECQGKEWRDSQCVSLSFVLASLSSPAPHPATATRASVPSSLDAHPQRAREC